MPELPDPFEVSTATIGHPRVARAIVSRFIAGDRVRLLAWDYSMKVSETERVIRWALVRLQERKSIR